MTSADPWGELEVALVQARAELAAQRAQPLLDAEQREQLQRDALAGELGAEMKRFAERVEAGSDTWEAAFTGASPQSSLLESHLARMTRLHAEPLRVLLEAEGFDPAAPPDPPRV